MLNDNDFDAFVTEVVAPVYRLQFDSVPVLDHDAVVGFFQGFLGAFPQVHHTIEDQIAEGDRVASRIVVRGTHQGDFMGIPPTGKDIAVKVINIHRIADGRIAEQWVVSDGLGMMQQLGLIPAPGAD